MKATSESQEKMRLDAMQSSLKILINSFYGYLGYTRGLFNDFGQADVVTTTGQELLKRMIEFIRDKQGTVIEVDTDGIFFVPPRDVADEANEMKFIEALSNAMPEGISVALDGRYRKMLSYKMKNYALLDYEGRMRVKGSSLISRAMERFGRSFVHQCIDCLLRDDIDGLHRIYMSLRNDIVEHTLDVRDFAKTEALKDSLVDYKRHVEMGRRHKSAAYEIALAAGRSFKPGDYVSFYITGNDANVKTFEKCRPVAEWDPNFPDENVAYYLRRLDEFSEKFRDFFEGPDFRSIFSPDDLFPFSAEGISVVTRALVSHKREEEDSIAEQALELDESSNDETD
jgi:DNA polymerase elongation subunit (family B)